MASPSSSSIAAFPESVEEAGALLGATITRYGQQQSSSSKQQSTTPSGMHSAFGVRQYSASSELLERLHALRALLRASEPPILAAPSILAVLLKLLPLSVNQARDAPTDTPVLASTPIRHLWIDCITLCHSRGHAISSVQFLQTMLSRASEHPRSLKAAGGVRVAALQVVASLVVSLPSKTTTPLAQDILNVCHKALKSAGYGEPTYREQAIQAASAVAYAFRQSNKSDKYLPNVVPEKCLVEVQKLLKIAVTDKFPEVRTRAAQCMSQWACFVTADEWHNIASKMLDDEAPYVAQMWAAAYARLLSMALIASQQHQQQPPTKFTSLDQLIRHLGSQFVKAGGEISAARLGGTYSTGGRAVRVGWALVLQNVLRYSEIEERTQLLLLVLQQMLGDDMNKQMTSGRSASGSSDSVGSFLAVTGSKGVAKADPGIARHLTHLVLWHGLIKNVNEVTQLNLLREMTNQLSETTWNGQQLMVLLTETSHLLAILGEAASAAVIDLVPRLESLLGYKDAGVRHEAALAFAAVSTYHPDVGRDHIGAAIDHIQDHYAQMVTLSSTSYASPRSPQSPAGLRMFRRPMPTKDRLNDTTMPHQHAIHGRTLAIALILRNLSQLPGGLPKSLLESVLSLAEMLVSCQYNETLTKSNAAAVCACVRGGFGIIAGALTTGPGVVAPHMARIFGAWHKACSLAKMGGPHLAPRHDLFCIDAVLMSVVVFLKYCSELLLSLPDALNQISVLLEDSLPLLMPEGRLCSMEMTPPVILFLESARASIFEAFSWLPSGSFPMVADDVFSFAAQFIAAAVESDVSCSILDLLVKREDSILDAKTFHRATNEGQVGGAQDLEEIIILLTAEAASHGEREAVLYLLPTDMTHALDSNGKTFHGSQILGIYASDWNEKNSAPTPLHEVGTWKRPIDPSCSSKVRLVDAAIQAFSATFGLKSGKEQQSAMDMLEAMVPPFLAQLARTIGINAALIEQDRRSKSKEDSAAVANITAVLLSCLQSLPLHEATHNIPIGLGPPWMNKAKDLLLTLLPSGSTIVRRAAAEGLSLLATLGVTEDAHFLQSTVLHSLDEVMQGNRPDGKAKTIALEPISAARAGSLLTLACIQRTAFNTEKRQQARARGRVKSQHVDQSVEKKGDGLPVLQMLTRILPSASCHDFKDYFVVKAYAIHAFDILLSYSNRISHPSLSDEDKQLLLKAIELVEDNFSSSWIFASNDLDRGQETEKMATEIAFLGALVRLMTSIMPSLHHVQYEKPEVTRRFALFSSLCLEICESHPQIIVETMAFYEILISKQDLLPSFRSNVDCTENPLFSCLPAIMSTLMPQMEDGISNPTIPGPTFSLSGISAVSCAIHAICRSENVRLTDLTDMRIVSALFLALENVTGSRYYPGARVLRPVAAPLENEIAFSYSAYVEKNIFDLIPLLLFAEEPKNDTGDAYLRWLLLSLSLLSTPQRLPDEPEDENTASAIENVIQLAIRRAYRDSRPILMKSSPIRWQLKCVAAQLSVSALDQILKTAAKSENEIRACSHFDYKAASNQCLKEYRDFSQQGGHLSGSKVIFHLQDLVSTACMSSAATIDQSEIRSLQEPSIYFLSKLVECFASVSDHEVEGSNVLEQYEQQIYSAVKHCISSINESQTIAAQRLFLAGCETLETIVKSGMADDTNTLKRLMRPIVPSSAELAFFQRNETPFKFPSKSDETHQCVGSADLIPYIAKVWLSCSVLLGPKNQRPESLTKELVTNELDLAVHCVAFAIDGVRLLCETGLSLDGRQANTTVDEKSTKRGFFYQNSDDLDDITKAVLASKWHECACIGMISLLESMESADDVKIEVCNEWLKSLVTIITKGIKDVLDASLIEQSNFTWAHAIKREELLSDCLKALSSIITKGSPIILDDQFACQIDIILDLLRESVFPLKLSNEVTPSASIATTKVLQEGCQLLYELSLREVSICDEDGFLITLLAPLEVLQVRISTYSESCQSLISTCLLSLGSLISKDRIKESIVRVTLSLVLDDILSLEKQYPEKLKFVGRTVLQLCLTSSYLGLAESQSIACELANSGNWEAWAALAPLRDGRVISKSLPIINAALSTATTSQIKLLCQIERLLHAATKPSEFCGRMLLEVGSSVLNILHSYGTLQAINVESKGNRISVCADAMKIMMTAFQHLLVESTEADMSTFLMILFRTMLPILRFNGLPNNPSPEEEGNTALGRMTAQAILHIAKTSPIPFKICLQCLDDKDRQLLEFAVRSAMTGYTIQTQAPTKKKLDIKNFKR